MLCSPQLAPQWQGRATHKFGIDAQLLLPSTVNRLMRSVPFGSNDLPALPVPGDLHRLHQTDAAAATNSPLHCPELVIVDEAHTCVGTRQRVGKSSQAHLRYTLLRKTRRRPEPAPAAADRHTAQR